MAKTTKQKIEVTTLVDRIAEKLAKKFKARVTITIEKGIKKHTIMHETTHDSCCIQYDIAIEALKKMSEITQDALNKIKQIDQS
jgi:hypothetical protein